MCALWRRIHRPRLGAVQPGDQGRSDCGRWWPALLHHTLPWPTTQGELDQTFPLSVLTISMPSPGLPEWTMQWINRALLPTTLKTVPPNGSERRWCNRSIFVSWVIPCQIIRFLAIFPRTSSDSFEIWHTYRTCLENNIRQIFFYLGQARSEIWLCEKMEKWRFFRSNPNFKWL